MELNAEQQQLLDRAALSGMSAEEVLEQAFAVVREQYRSAGWLGTEAVAKQIAAGYEEAKRGELIDPAEARRVLAERRARRQRA